MAALIIEVIFGAAGLIPRAHHAEIVEAGLHWNYTTWLNMGFLILACVLLWRFFATDGLNMLRMMSKPTHESHHHHHVH